MYASMTAKACRLRSGLPIQLLATHDYRDPTLKGWRKQRIVVHVYGRHVVECATRDAFSAFTALLSAFGTKVISIVSPCPMSSRRSISHLNPYK